jgi:hypothetical protein
VFFGALVAELLVCITGYFEVIAYLWLNVLGCLLVVLLSLLIQALKEAKRPKVKNTA